MQDWIVEEYSQTLDNFIKESQSELSEEITESLNERINEAKKEIFSLVVAEAFQVGFFPSFSAEEATSIVSEFLESFRYNR